MLVLTRKLMEKLYIGDEICVTVVRLEGGQVRLGIEAPREISVIRAELLPSDPASAGAAHPQTQNAPTANHRGRRQRREVAGVGVGVGAEGADLQEVGGVTPRPVGVPGIGSRLRGPSR
jgi:carbon storage regulator